MRRLGILGGLVLVLAMATGVGDPVRADHEPGTPVVEGGAWYKVVDSSDTEITMLYSCRTFVSGQRVSASFVQCRVQQGDPPVVKDTTVLGQEGNAVITVPRLLTIENAPFQICWESWAIGRHGERIDDVTEPNCIDGQAVAS